MDDDERRVYFMQAGVGGPIKIGSSADPEMRRAKLQTGLWMELTVLGTCVGGDTREWLLHHQMRAHRIRGEWFAATDEVLATVTRCIAGDGDATWFAEWMETYGSTVEDYLPMPVSTPQPSRTAEEQAAIDAHWTAFLTAWDEEHGVVERQVNQSQM